MLTFKEMHLTVYRRDSGEGMVALNARDPVGGEQEGGINYLSFYFTQAEFCDLLSGKTGAVTDIGHNVRRAGELYTFYDPDFPANARGIMRVPYVNVQIPHYVARLLVRLARAKLKKAEPNGERLRVDLPWETRERWERRYGQGLGQVQVVYDDATGAFLDECRAKGGETFKRCLDGLEAIARNTTFKWTDTGVVVLSKDWDGFYFRIKMPKGHVVLNGGVVNHGRDGAHSWSTHT